MAFYLRKGRGSILYYIHRELVRQELKYKILDLLKHLLLIKYQIRQGQELLFQEKLILKYFIMATGGYLL